MINYSEHTLAHFFHPKNVGAFAPEEQGVGSAVVGNYENGTLLHFQVKISEGKIEAAKFKAYGPCLIIACCSYVTEWVTSKTIAQANEFTSAELVKVLAIPQVKIYSAVLLEDALKAAISNGMQKLSHVPSL
jgi:nitrogen fixation protein NifU and related proteins